MLDYKYTLEEFYNMEKLRNFVLKFYDKIIYLFSFFIILFLTVNSFFFTAYMPSIVENRSEYTYYYSDNIFLTIMALLLFIFSGVLIKKLKIKLSDNKKIIKYLLVLTGIVSIIWIFMANTSVIYDSLECFQAAKDFLKGDYSFLNTGEYLYLYPYQLGLVFFEQCLYKLFGVNTLLVFQILNCISMIVTLFLIIKIFDMLFKKENNSLLMCILSCLFLSYTFYCSFVYGNLISFCLSVVSIYYFILFCKNDCMWKKVVFLILSILFISFSYCIKSTALITIISLLIISFIHFISKRKKINLIYMLLLVLSFSLPIKIIYSYYEKVSGIEINSGIPMIGWVAMGLHDSKRGEGWYDASTVDNYEKVNYDSKKFSDLSLKDIKDSISKFKSKPKYTIKFFYKKISSQWNNPTFQSLWKLTDTAQNRIARSIVKGKLHDFVYVYSNYFQVIIYLGSLLFLILYREKCDYWKMYFLLIFIGGFVFYCFWEAKAQYTFQFFVLLIPYASIGYNKLFDIILKKVDNKRYDIFQRKKEID